MDNGKPIWEARADLESVISSLEYYGGLAPAIVGYQVQRPGRCPHSHNIQPSAAGAAARRQLGPRLPGAAGRGGRGGGLELPPADLHLEGTGYWLYCTVLYYTVPYCRWPPPSPAATPSCTSPRRSPRWSRWCWGRCWPRPGCPRGSTTSCRSHITAAVPINSTSEERCPH